MEDGPLRGGRRRLARRERRRRGDDARVGRADRARRRDRHRGARRPHRRPVRAGRQPLHAAGAGRLPRRLPRDRALGRLRGEELARESLYEDDGETRTSRCRSRCATCTRGRPARSRAPRSGVKKRSRSSIVGDLLARPAGVLGVDLLDPPAQLERLLRVDLDVGRLALEAAAGLVDEDPRVGQRRALARRPAGEEQRAHRHRDAAADGRHVGLDELHRVVDRQAGVDDARRAS